MTGLIITIILAVLLVGVVAWLMDRSPFDQMIRWAIIALSVVLAILWVASRIGAV